MVQSVLWSRGCSWYTIVVAIDLRLVFLDKNQAQTLTWTVVLPSIASINNNPCLLFHLYLHRDYVTYTVTKVRLSLLIFSFVDCHAYAYLTMIQYPSTNLNLCRLFSGVHHFWQYNCRFHRLLCDLYGHDCWSDRHSVHHVEGAWWCSDLHWF